MRSIRFIRVGACAGATIAVLGLTSSAALASSSGPKVGHQAGPAVSRPASTPGAISSSIGGYVVSPSEGITTVSSSFVLPKTVTCPVTNSNQVYLGDVMTPSTGDEFQGGADVAYAQVEMTCSGGAVQYTAIADVSGTTYEFTPYPGNTIQTRLVETPAGRTIATVHDVTINTTTEAFAPTNASATQIILGAEVSGPQIPKFTKVPFSNSQVGGLDWSQTSPAPQPYTFYDGGNAKLTPSAVPATPSTSFTLTEKSV